MLKWHREGEQKMAKSSKQKTQMKACVLCVLCVVDSTQTHTMCSMRWFYAWWIDFQFGPQSGALTHRYKQKTTCTGYDTGGDRPPGPGAELVKGFLPRSQTTNVGIPSFNRVVLSGTKRAAAAAAICTRKRENREPRSLVKVSWDKEGSLLGDGWERQKFVEAAVAIIHRKRTKSSEILP